MQPENGKHKYITDDVQKQGRQIFQERNPKRSYWSTYCDERDTLSQVFISVVYTQKQGDFYLQISVIIEDITGALLHYNIRNFLSLFLELLRINSMVLFKIKIFLFPRSRILSESEWNFSYSQVFSRYLYIHVV